ncbi:MAG: gliding motility-associated C-terminal domain-containing protein, partial [Bacteroidota bacterium]
LELTASANNASLTGWLIAPDQANIQITESGVYTAFAENACFRVEDELEISTTTCTTCLEIPNIFTPNRDGLNDQFTPLIGCAIESYELVVYNRWGGVVFQTNDPDQPWDGTFQEIPQPSDTYAFTLDILFIDPDEEDRQIKGEINLIR